MPRVRTADRTPAIVKDSMSGQLAEHAPHLPKARRTIEDMFER
jgi:hypothetical protein